MNFRSFIAIMLLVFVPSLGYSKSHDVSKIVAATFEDTVSAQVVRLVTSKENGSADRKIVCGEDMIRIRLDGVTNSGRKLQDLKVVGRGPVRRARIVEKNKKNSVLQIFPRRQPLNTCSRTTVAELGGEIIISVSRTDNEIERRTRKAERSKNATAKAAEILEASESKQNAIEQEKTVESNVIETKPKKDNEKKSTLFSKEKDKKDNLKMSNSGENMMVSKAVLGFGFAAILAGVALYLKKKKKFSIEEFENIEIISTKRLGLKQQLMLVSVQGTKFLLAVGEKTVSSLGTVPGENSEEMRLLPQANQVKTHISASKENVSEVLEKLIGEASRHAAMPVAEETKPDTVPGFDSDLKLALERAINRKDKKSAVLEKTPPPPHGSNLTGPKGNGADSTNAAGLIALARMRANLKKGNDKSQIFEA